MKISTMRCIDELVGIPICAGLSMFSDGSDCDIAHFRSLESPKILFIHLSEMGAFVIAQPAIAELKRRLPQARLYFLVFPPINELIQELGLTPAERIFTIPKNSFTRLATATLRTLKTLRRIGIDAVINQEGYSRFAAILSYLACPHGLRVGHYPYGMRGLYKGRMETHKVQYNDHIHASRSYLNLVNSLWADPQDTPLLKDIQGYSARIEVTPQLQALTSTFENYLPLEYEFHYQPKASDLAKVEEILYRKGARPGQELIIVNPNSSDMLPHRRWDLENYVEVCRQLLAAHPQTAIVVTGTAEESNGAKHLQRCLPEAPILDLTGDTSVGELLALYTRCRLMITNDSGPAHFASVVNLPTVVIYGPETPLLFSPLGHKCCQLYANVACSPCVSPYNNKNTSCRRHNLCMSCIKPFQVIQATEKMLSFPSK